MFELDVKTVD